MSEHYSRVQSMISDEDDTWDLSPNDIDALRNLVGIVNLLAQEFAEQKGIAVETAIAMFSELASAQKAESK